MLAQLCGSLLVELGAYKFEYLRGLPCLFCRMQSPFHAYLLLIFLCYWQIWMSVTSWKKPK